MIVPKGLSPLAQPFFAARYTSMTYEITPEHFGFTSRLKLLLAVGSLACSVVPMLTFPLIRASLAWSPVDIVAALLTWIGLAFYWYAQHSYT
jgi:hypothetical protein